MWKGEKTQWSACKCCLQQLLEATSNQMMYGSLPDIFREEEMNNVPSTEEPSPLMSSYRRLAPLLRVCISGHQIRQPEESDVLT